VHAHANAEKLDKVRREHNWRYIIYAIGGAVAITACNSISVLGQWAWSTDALRSWGIPGQIAFSVGAESVAIFCGATALLCDLEDSPSFRLRITSMATGIAIGILNYSHDPGTAVGIVTGAFSVACPLLWDTLGRKLAEPQLIEAGNGNRKHRFPRLGVTRWAYHPAQSASIMRHETMQPTGDDITRKAITAWNDRRSKRLENKVVEQSTGRLSEELAEIGS
jgi:hypothetical protein